MPSKDVNKRREAIRKHYYKNRQYYIDKALKQKADIREWVYELKNKTPCGDCGVQYPHYVTDFDHVRGIKKNNISALINQGSSIQVKQEIEKCDLVCSNCHRERTYNRRQRDK